MEGRGAPPSSGPRRDEAGSILIMAALILGLMIGMSAFVIDLSFMRHDKRASQSAADMAAVAGAYDLPVDGQGSGFAACETAWGYVVENTSITPGTPSPCTTPVHGDFTLACQPTVENQAVATVEPYVVTITWPVTEGRREDLLGDRVQGTDGEPCDRMAVQIRRERGFFLAGGIFGVSEGFTTAPAVARGVVGFEDVDVSSLVVLDPVGCGASGPMDIRGSGGSGVFVHESPTGGPGIVTIDADGSACADANNQRLFHYSGNNAQVKAGVYAYDGDKGKVRNGVIHSYAVEQGRPKPTLWQSTRVPSATSSDSAGQLVGGHPSPREPVAGPRFTRAPVVHRYDCRDTYGTGTVARPHAAIPDCPGSERAPVGSQYLTNLRASVAGAPPAGQFTVHTGSACTIGADLTLPAGNHWFACALSINSGRTLTIPDGNVVVTNGVDLQGTLNVNTSANDRWMVIRSGNLDRTSTSSLNLGNADGGVFVYMQNGVISTQGSGDQTRWIAPHTGPFEDLALWSDAPGTHEMLGSAALYLEGVFYIPNAQFSFGGGGNMSQQDAQFIVYRFHTHGGGALKMIPNPERNIADPRLKVSLIR